MKNRFIVKLGDPSNDGHGECETVVIRCNKTTKEIEKAYEKSCESTGLVFTENTDVIVGGEKMNWQHPEYTDRKLCVEYQSYEPSELAWSVLSKYGLVKDDYLVAGEDDLENEAFLDLFLDFVTLSLPGLEYEIEDDNTEVLDLTIGYGRFD